MAGPNVRVDLRCFTSSATGCGVRKLDHARDQQFRAGPDGVGCENSITPLTSSFVPALTDPDQPQESQNSQRELRHAAGADGSRTGELTDRRRYDLRVPAAMSTGLDLYCGRRRARQRFAQERPRPFDRLG